MIIAGCGNSSIQVSSWQNAVVRRFGIKILSLIRIAIESQYFERHHLWLLIYFMIICKVVLLVYITNDFSSVDLTDEPFWTFMSSGNLESSQKLIWGLIQFLIWQMLSTYRALYHKHRLQLTLCVLFNFVAYDFICLHDTGRFSVVHSRSQCSCQHFLPITPPA